MNGFKYSYTSLVYADEDVATSIDRVARFGYAIELVAEPTRYDASQVRKLTVDAGIVVGSIVSIFTAERDLAHPDPDARRRAVDYVKSVADFVSEVGAPTMIIAPTAVMKTEPLADPGDERKWALEGILEGGRYAHERGVKLALECWNRYETYWLNRLEQALEFLRDVDLPNIGVMGDTFHMNIEEKSVGGALQDAGPRLMHVHTCENDRGTPGSGHVPWTEVAHALAAVGYERVVSIESFVPQIEELARAVSLWRPVFTSGDDLARDGLSFLKGLLESPVHH